MASETVVRIPVEPREQSRRTLDQRLYLRFPRLAAASIGMIGGLPPRSRLRQAALRRGTQLGAAAYNRRDLDAVVIAYHPEFEYMPGRKWIEAGLVEPRYVGREGYRKYVKATEEVWGVENHFRPLEIIDLGDRVVVLAEETMRHRPAASP